MTTEPLKKRRIKSFVKRDSRMTASQRKAFQKLSPLFQLNLQPESSFLNFLEIFQREAPCILEIGFGSGQSLLQIAKEHPEENFIGIETHLPGIGALLVGIEKNHLTNIRFFYADAVEVLNQSIPNESLETIQIFFPDPWHKRKHHKRRLIQTELVNLLVAKLKSKGKLHLATDWEDYAKQMMKVISLNEQVINLAGHGKFSDRSSQRPVVTKFEARGEKSGRVIWELQFAKC